MKSEGVGGKDSKKGTKGEDWGLICRMGKRKEA